MSRNPYAALLVLVGLIPLACKGPAPSAPPPPVAASPDVLPAWRLEPLSWQKLDEMERWLASPASQSAPAFRIEAELQLSEGRVTFAQKDAESGNVPAETLQVRLQAAREDLQKLLASGKLSPGQTTRARIAIQKTDALVKMPPKQAPQQGLAITTRAQWNAMPAKAASMTPLKGQWSRITVHHSAEETSDPVKARLDDSAHTVRLIQKYHMEDPDHHWGDIGYHFLIDSSGRIFQGRDLKWQGAHAGGANNNQNIGVCMLGDFVQRSPTLAALKSLELLIEYLRKQYEIADPQLYGHHDLNPSTECPGPTLLKWTHAHR